MDSFLQIVHWDYILGGFALFLFGIYFMGEGLKNSVGEKLQYYISKYTSTPWKGMLVGTGITFFIQSSSATTGIVIGLVRARLLTMKQAVGVIIGANIGTTATSLMIGLNLDQYALYFIFLGVICMLFMKQKKAHYLGKIILGFGILFLGCTLMGNELLRFESLQEFQKVASAMKDRPFISMLVGAFMTAIVQSSSVVISSMQSFYSMDIFSLYAALPFIFGSNIGTTITAVIASLGGSKQSKQTACVHVLFNLSGGLLFMLLIEPFVQILTYIETSFIIQPSLLIALSHLLFNLTTAFIIYPFIPYIVTLIQKIIPDDEQVQEEIISFRLDTKLVDQLPSSALNISRQACVKMGELFLEGITECHLYYINNEDKNSACSHKIHLIHKAQKEIAAYLVQITHQTMSQEVIDDSIHYLNIIKCYDYSVDLMKHLLDYQQEVIKTHAVYHENAKRDIDEMFLTLQQMSEIALQFLIKADEISKREMQDLNNYLNLIEEKARLRHYHRLSNKEEKSAIIISSFIDIISTLARIGNQLHEITK